VEHLTVTSVPCLRRLCVSIDSLPDRYTAFEELEHPYTLLSHLALPSLTEIILTGVALNLVIPHLITALRRNVLYLANTLVIRIHRIQTKLDRILDEVAALFRITPNMVHFTLDIDTLESQDRILV
jgi:hypothetical protein